MTETRSATLIGPLFPHVKQLTNDAKTRRLQLFKTKYGRPTCRVCTTKAYYMTLLPERTYWCREHLPAVLKRRLSAEWQMRNIVLPLARYLN